MKDLDTSKYFLGSLCKRGHDWEGIGQSLRRRRSGQCIQCHQEKNKESRTRNVERILISSTNNLHDFDVTKFYLGVLCKESHQWQETNQSLRYLSSRNCLKCQEKGSLKSITKKKELSQIRVNLLGGEGEITYLGELCKNSHYWEDTSKSLRLIKTNRCLRCQKESESRKYEKNKETIVKRSKSYYANNKEYVLSRCAKYRTENKEYIKNWKAEHYKKNRERILKRNAENRQKNLEGWKEYYSRWRQTPAGKLSRNGSERKRRIRKKTNHSFPYTTTQLKERFRDFDNCCAYCGNAATSIEHFIPISSGGADVIGNILPACGKCNSSKCNHNALVWYKSQKFYTKKRWQKILRILGLSENTLGQMPLF